MLKIPFEKMSHKRSIALFLMYYVTILLTHWSILKNPITYLVGLVLLFKCVHFLIRKKTKGIAIIVLDHQIICNNSILNLNLRILKSSIESIDVDRKIMIVNGLEKSWRTRLLSYLNKNKILLTHVSRQDLMLLREDVFPEKSFQEKVDI